MKRLTLHWGHFVGYLGGVLISLGPCSTPGALEQHPHPAIAQLFAISQQHHDLFQQQTWQAELAQIQVRSLRSEFFPEFSFSANGVYPQGAERKNHYFSEVEWSDTLNFRQVIFNRGKEWYYHELAQVLPRLTSSQQAVARSEHYERIINAFFTWITADWQSQRLGAQLQLITKRAQFLLARSKIGRAKETDYLSVLALEKKWQIKRAQLETLVAEYHQELVLAVGAETGLLPQVGIGEWDFRPFQKPLIKWRTHFEQRPAEKLFQEQRAKAQLEVELARTSYYPLVRFEGNYHFFTRASGRQDDWDLGASLSWPIFDFGRTNNSLAEKKVQLLVLESQQAQWRREQWGRYLAQEQAFFNIQKQILGHQELWSLSQRIFRQLQQDAEHGLATTFELNAAMEELLEAEQNLNQAQFSLAQKWYQLGLAAGEWGQSP